jgi:hypothetical protein
VATSDAPKSESRRAKTETLEELNRRIAEEAAAETTADKVNPKD